jgi:hypothetical protein
MRALYISVLLTCLISSGRSQNFQAGLGLAANNTFFHKGSSEYVDANTGGAIVPAAGVFASANFRLSDSWTARSGLGFHVKKYRVVTENIDFPEVAGEFHFDAGFNCLEVPLVIAYRTSKPKVYKFEYSAGVVCSYYIPVQMGTGYAFEGAVPAALGIYSTRQAWQNTYSPDLFLSVGLLKMDNKERRHEFAISYQYGLAATSEFRYTAFLSNDAATRVYQNVMKPTLSSFMLKYTFYPRWLSFGPLEASE